MEKKKKRYLLRILGILTFLIITMGDAASSAWQTFRKKWHKLV